MGHLNFWDYYHALDYAYFSTRTPFFRIFYYQKPFWTFCEWHFWPASAFLVFRSNFYCHYFSLVVFYASSDYERIQGISGASNQDAFSPYMDGGYFYFF